MEQRGRKSAARLAIAPVATLKRIPDPPQHLTLAQADVWRGVMRTVVAEMITEDAHPVLVEFCRAVDLGNQVASQLAAFDPAWLADDDGLKRWDKLTQIQHRNQGVIAALGGKLRINPSSRVRAENAATVMKRGNGGKRKPWESED